MTLNLTNAGLNLLLRALAGEQLLFTRVQIGNGAPQSASSAEALSNPLLELPIQGITIGGANITLQTKFNNSTVTAGFRHTETGIWVKAPTASSAEVLYAYGAQPEATADYISSTEDSILETQIDFLVFVGEAENVSAAINESLVYASAEDLQNHIKDTENPHKVSPAQIGLGKVPNVATNDQTPTYSTALTLASLSSGEKLSTAFGKIARAILSLIGHIGNKNNPHGVEPDQIGAAPSAHAHSTADITRGTLGVARGGTGKDSWAANRLIYPVSANEISQLPFPMQDGAFLRQDKSGAPYWGAASESGTYVGGGHSGSNDKSSITFKNGVPNAVLIVQRGGVQWGLLLPNTATPVGFSIVNNVTSNLNVETSDNTVYWYYNTTDAHPANQLDTNSQTYVFVGIH